VKRLGDSQLWSIRGILTVLRYAAADLSDWALARDAAMVRLIHSSTSPLTHATARPPILTLEGKPSVAYTRLLHNPVRSITSGNLKNLSATSTTSIQLK
jgi:hypothetical protein